MSSMLLQKFQIHKFFLLFSLPFVFLAPSCSKAGASSFQSAGQTAGQTAGQAAVALTDADLPVSDPFCLTPTESDPLPETPAGGEVLLARAEKILPYPDASQLAKFEAVFASLSPRARRAMAKTEANPAEFLFDLENLLAEEECFRSDDLSLFYLIDKKHNVSSDYVPKDLVHLEKNELFDINKNNLSLRPEAYDALCEMAQDALDDGIRLLVSSTYRSYEYQKWLFQHWVDVDGLEEAERESARAGTSQHQLGTAVDFGSVSDDFADTAMGQWVYAHSEDYGWSLSFPQGYEDVTGFRWESWHFRYIGKPACRFQMKWFSDVQQFMIEFIDAWKAVEVS